VVTVVEQIRTDRSGRHIVWFPLQADQLLDRMISELTFPELSDEHIQGRSGDIREAALLRTNVHRLSLSHTPLSNPHARGTVEKGYYRGAPS